jgi:hypothetical protein
MERNRSGSRPRHGRGSPSQGGGGEGARPGGRGGGGVSGEESRLREVLALYERQFNIMKVSESRCRHRRSGRRVQELVSVETYIIYMTSVSLLLILPNDCSVLHNMIHDLT